MSYGLKNQGIYTEEEWKTAVGIMLSKGTYGGNKCGPKEIMSIVNSGKKKKWELSYKLNQLYLELFNVEVEYEELDIKDPVESDLIIAEKLIHKYNSCLDRNIDFKLTFAEFKRITSRTTCYYTGEKLNEVYDDKDVKFNKSIDRIDSNGGYTKDNTVICCHYINTLKNDLFENPVSNIKITKHNLQKVINKIPDNY